MRRHIGALALVMAASGAAVNSAAAQGDNLTEAQQALYNRQRLSVEVIGVGMGSVGYTSASYASWTKWIAYEGFSRIPEDALFRKAGYEREANRAASYRGTTNLLAWGGIGVSTAGLVMFAAGGESALSLVGVGMALGGLIPAWIGIVRLNSNWAPYSTVSGIAEQYNRALVVRIKQER